ncbi:MAG: tetratricopeptide repeat protein [candidate division WOR-3 bacterium]|uniref:Tetratricopeptide repeat protein n=1 Tax=candidate division WOR-3 bacterium TaxID=2052148 RepID=A0A7C1NNC8_UNCW3|nr:tetratricopeptide repeat protein [candidate division WOR-3 bacterium]
MREKHTPLLNKSKKNLSVLLPLSATLLIRLWFVLEMRHHPFSSLTPQVVDSWFYHRWALEIIKGNLWGTEVFFLRPLYPYLLAAIYRLFGPQVIPVQIFQTLLAVISCFMLMKTTERLFNLKTAVIAGLGFALCGVLIFYTGTLLYVEITVFFTLLTILLLLKMNRWWHALLAGISFGLLVICRPELLALLPLLIWGIVKFHKVHVNSAISFAVASILVIGLVPLRNYLVARDPVVFTAHSGINFYFGNNPEADGTWQPVKDMNLGFGFSHQRLKQIAKTVNGQEVSWSQASSWWFKQGLRFITSSPGKFLKLLWRKLLLFFCNYEVPNNYYFETVLPFSRVLKFARLNWSIIIALGIPGIILAGRQWRQRWLLYVFIGGYFISALVFYVLSRLRAPTIPLFLPFTSYAFLKLYHFYRDRRVPVGIRWLAISLAVYLVSNLIPVNRHHYSAQAWTQLGNIYLEQKRAMPALQALNKALQYDPNNYSARYSLIELYAGMRRIADAEHEFEQLQRSSPEAREILHLAAARIAVARRDFISALRHYQSAIQINPLNPEAFYLTGLVYVSIGDLVNAQKYLTLSLQLDPDHEAARSALYYIKHEIR